MGKSWVDGLKGLSNLSLGFGGSTLVGLSVGSSSVKMVELKRSGKNFQLLHFGVAELQDETIVNREIVNSVAVTEAIRSLAANLGIKNKNVVSCLSGTSLVIKKMSLEVTNPKEIQEQVFWEAEQYLPFDPAEVVMDFQVVSAPKTQPTEVILVAVKGTALDSYMAAISDAGLKPKVMDTDYFALQNVFEINYPQLQSSATLLVDVGAAAMKMVVVYAGVPIFTKDTTLGGKSLTQEIQRTLDLPYADAEALKVGGQAGALPQEVSDLIQQQAENIAQEVKRTVDFYNASSTGPPVAGILLTGGGCKLPNLSRMTEELADIPTQILNPFNVVSYDPSVFTAEYIASIGPLASIPIGLAARGVK